MSNKSKITLYIVYIVNFVIIFGLTFLSFVQYSNGLTQQYNFGPLIYGVLLIIIGPLLYMLTNSIISRSGRKEDYKLIYLLIISLSLVLGFVATLVVRL